MYLRQCCQKEKKSWQKNKISRGYKNKKKMPSIKAQFNTQLKKFCVQMNDVFQIPELTQRIETFNVDIETDQYLNMFSKEIISNAKDIFSNDPDVLQSVVDGKLLFFTYICADRYYHRFTREEIETFWADISILCRNVIILHSLGDRIPFFEEQAKDFTTNNPDVTPGQVQQKVLSKIISDPQFMTDILKKMTSKEGRGELVSNLGVLFQACLTQRDICFDPDVVEEEEEEVESLKDEGSDIADMVVRPGGSAFTCVGERVNNKKQKGKKKKKKKPKTDPMKNLLEIIENLNLEEQVEDLGDGLETNDEEVSDMMSEMRQMLADNKDAMQGGDISSMLTKMLPTILEQTGATGQAGMPPGLLNIISSLQN